MAVSFTTLHFTGHLNGLTPKQQLLSHCGFTGVGVRNNGEGAALGNFFVQSFLIYAHSLLFNLNVEGVSEKIFNLEIG